MSFERTRKHRRAGLAWFQIDPFGKVTKRWKSEGPAPAPVANVTRDQSSSNINSSLAQQQMNMIDRNGPGGSVKYTPTGDTYTDPATGQVVPRYSQNTTLSPLGQSLLDAQGNVVNSQLPGIQSEAAGYKPLDVTGGANAGIVAQGPQAFENNVADAIYNKQAGFLNPQWGQSENELTDKLSRQGIPLGSDAYNRSMTNFNNSKTQAYDAARNSATTGGAQAGATNFGLALAGQNQNVTNQQLAQQNPAKLLSLLNSGA
jgi:hypothetical protein